MFVSFVDEMTEQKVQCPIFPSFIACCYVLHMSHLFRLKDDDACYNALILTNQINLDFSRETRHQECNLVQRMHRTRLMMSHQDIGQECPVFFQTFHVSLSHTVDVESMIYRFLGLTNTEGSHAELVMNGDYRTDQATVQLSACTEEGIEILCAWVGTIYIRYRFIDQLASLHVIHVIEHHILQDTHHLQFRYLWQNH